MLFGIRFSFSTCFLFTEQKKTIILNLHIFYTKTSTAKQVLGNCERIVLAVNAVKLCVNILVVNLYIVLVHLCTSVLYMLSLS